MNDIVRSLEIDGFEHHRNDSLNEYGFHIFYPNGKKNDNEWLCIDLFKSFVSVSYKYNGTNVSQEIDYRDNMRLELQIMANAIIMQTQSFHKKIDKLIRETGNEK